MREFAITQYFFVFLHSVYLFCIVLLALGFFDFAAIISYHILSHSPLFFSVVFLLRVFEVTLYFTSVFLILLNSSYVLYLSYIKFSSSCNTAIYQCTSITYCPIISFFYCSFLTRAIVSHSIFERLSAHLLLLSLLLSFSSFSLIISVRFNANVVVYEYRRRQY